MMKFSAFQREGLIRAMKVMVVLAVPALLAACSIIQQDVFLESPEGSEEPSQKLFSVQLPSGWEATYPQAGGDSWSGSLSGDGITLNFLGGPYATSEIYRTLKGGGDQQMELRHVNFGEEINGQQGTLVRPRTGQDGLTGLVLDLPTRRLVFTAEGLSEDEQKVAFKVFRSISP